MLLISPPTTTTTYHHHHAETIYVIFGGNDHPETEMTIQKRNVWTSEEVTADGLSKPPSRLATAIVLVLWCTRTHGARPLHERATVCAWMETVGHKIALLLQLSHNDLRLGRLGRVVAGVAWA